MCQNVHPGSEEGLITKAVKVKYIFPQFCLTEKQVLDLPSPSDGARDFVKRDTKLNLHVNLQHVLYNYMLNMSRMHVQNESSL